MANLLTAVGLMSGTSMDGIDAAIIETDGKAEVKRLCAASTAYDAGEREIIERAVSEARGLSNRDDRPGALAEAEHMITMAHAHAVEALISQNGMERDSIDIVGFHGQTVLHRPERALTVQIGDGAALAERLSLPVVNDLRAADIASGGQGAPLAPVYHRALARLLPERPVVFLNIGGIANVTWVGDDGKLISFDTGPGNGLLDQWADLHLDEPLDRDGALARAGQCDEAVLHELLMHPYFAQPAPKSLDRGDFSLDAVNALGAANGAATLAHFTASSIARSAAWFSLPPAYWVVCGGGRHNRMLMELLASYVEAPVCPAEACGLDGDMIEAEAFAYLAVRSLKRLPITFPSTTGAPGATCGGVVHMPCPDHQSSA